MSRSLTCVVLCLLSAVAVAAPVAGTDPAILAARIWGLAKYHHPELVRCVVDWDRALLDRWAGLEAAEDAEAAQSAIGDLLGAAGNTPQQPLDALTPEWIAQAPLDEGLKRRLAWLAAQRPQQQCKVSPAPGTRQANFDSDIGHARLMPDRPHRALAALRYWNAIEYFFPYKMDIGRDWAEVLAEHLPQVLDAEPGQPFALAMRRFSAEIQDGHAGLSAPQALLDYRAGFPPFAVRPIEGFPTVVRVALQASEQVRPGDRLLAVDGEPVGERLARFDAIGYGSNPASRLDLVSRYVVAGDDALGRFRFARPDGSEYEIELPRGQLNTAMPPSHPVWRVEQLDSCAIGVVDMARLRPEDVDAALQAVAATDALLFDVRNYPQGTMWPLVDRLYAAPTLMAELSFPRLDQPGRFDTLQNVLGGSRPNGYRGRILLLQDQNAISQSEFSLMGLQADGRAISFGSQTAGADGNITHVYTPGDLRLTFTGLGVFYPDGRVTQRVGIVPDVHVTPTRQGIADGRDEVLQAALDCRWIDAEPPRRRPLQGLFSSPQRDGEGIDVQRDAGSGTIAVFSYHYDAEGRPEWLLSVDNDPASGVQSGFAAFERTGSSTPRPGYTLDFHAGPYFPVCAVADQSALHPRGRWQWPGSAVVGESCVLPLLSGEPGAAAGTYAGEGEEVGWGLSVHQAGDQLALVVYAYDGGGHPRWLLAQGEWSGTGPANFELLRAGGYCQGCPATPISLVEAGSLTLRFADLQSSAGHRLDIHADFGDGVPWVRENMPLRRVSRPSQP
jgi:hypothetical protein